MILWCEVLTHRVKDGAILRLLRKWLKAGGLEGEPLSYPERGSPQGGVISPGRANIFLDCVLDHWCEREVGPRMTGRCFLIRYCDHFVIGCEREADARRILAVLPKRLARLSSPFIRRRPAWCSSSRRVARTKASVGTGRSTSRRTDSWAKSRRGYGGYTAAHRQEAVAARNEGGVALVPPASA